MRPSLLLLLPLLAACSAPRLGAGPGTSAYVPAAETYSQTLTNLLGEPQARPRRNGRRPYLHARFPAAAPQGLREWLEDQEISPREGPRWRIDRWEEKVILPGGTEVEIHKGDPPPEEPPSAGYRWAEERLQEDLDRLRPPPKVGP